MKLTWIASAALALGASALVPSMAQAHDRYDRDYRGGYYGGVYYSPNVDADVPLCDVPGRVMRTAECERRGLPIKSVQYVNRFGHQFYRFQIDAPRGRDFNIRVSPNGALLGVEAAGPLFGYDGFRRG